MIKAGRLGAAPRPSFTDPVAGGGGRREERTTGAEGLRAGGPAAPYIRPPSSEDSGGGGGRSAGGGSSAPPAGTPHAYITQQRPRRLCYPGRAGPEGGQSRPLPPPVAAAQPGPPRSGPGHHPSACLLKRRPGPYNPGSGSGSASCGGLRSGPSKHGRPGPAASLARRQGAATSAERSGCCALPNLRRREKSQKFPMRRQLRRYLLFTGTNASRRRREEMPPPPRRVSYRETSSPGALPSRSQVMDLSLRLFHSFGLGVGK